MLGQKINPMLFIRANSLENLFLEWEEVVASPKIDGIRVLAHKIGNRIILMSRTGNDVTDKFPSIAESLKKQIVKDFILDCEMVSVNESKILPFSEAMAKFQGNETSGKGIACLMLFDCLWLNDDITYLPFVERFARAINSIYTFNNLQFIPHSKMKDEVHIEELYRKVLSKGYEGLVLRDAHAPYEFCRTNSVRKIKPLHTFDLKIVDKKPNPNGSTTYILEPVRGSKTVKVNDFRSFNVGDTVEIAYEKITEKGSLKFPRIIRLREKITLI